jgi:hypothetical protein
MIQMELWERTELEQLQDKVSSQDGQIANLRRGLFQRFGDLDKKLGSYIMDTEHLVPHILRLEARIRDLEARISDPSAHPIDAALPKGRGPFVDIDDLGCVYIDRLVTG